MNKFVIEKGLPMPEFSASGRPAKYPFSEMQVGDSFVLPEDQLIRIRSAAANWGTRQGKKLSVRQLKDGSYRCWRLK